MRRLLLALTVLAISVMIQPSSASAQEVKAPASIAQLRSYEVVDCLLAQSAELHFTDQQVVDLKALSTRLGHERGRLVITGFDKVPGKSVPWIERRKTSPQKAFKEAMALLTPEQQQLAVRALDGCSEPAAPARE